MILAYPARAEEWQELESPDRSFTVPFPTDTNLEIVDYRTPDGRSFDARVYSTTHDTGVLRLTVAEVPETGSQTEERALMTGAVKKMTDGSLIKFDIEHRIRWI